MSDADDMLTGIEAVIGRIGDEDNQFGSAAAGWVWWQDAAEELAALVGGLDLAIRRGGPLPAAWAPDPLEPLAPVSCCDHHAGWADAPACDDGEPDGSLDPDPCPDDPDGLHHAGCGCEDVDPLNPNERQAP